MSNDQKPVVTAVTSVRVEYGETANLGDYNNVRPSVALTASVSPDDDHAQVTQQLLDEARKFVNTAVDDALEAENRAPRYYSGPRFEIKLSPKRKAVVVLPHNLNTRGVYDLTGAYGISDSIRLEKAVQWAQAYIADNREGWQLCVCANGDLSGLPALPPEKTFAVNREAVMRGSSADSPDEQDDDE